MEAYIEAAKRMHGQQEKDLRQELESQTAHVQELRTQLNQATRDAAANAKAQRELSVTGKRNVPSSPPKPE
jgi:cell division protein FtsB